MNIIIRWLLIKVSGFPTFFRRFSPNIAVQNIWLHLTKKNLALHFTQLKQAFPINKYAQ